MVRRGGAVAREQAIQRAQGWPWHAQAGHRQARAEGTRGARDPGGPVRVASFMKDFVVVKDFPRYHTENPSQQQKFT
jgi:hypothetical protein